LLAGDDFLNLGASDAVPADMDDVLIVPKEEHPSSVRRTSYDVKSKRRRGNRVIDRLRGSGVVVGTKTHMGECRINGVSALAH
jgi:hypothetical protein